MNTGLLRGFWTPATAGATTLLYDTFTDTDGDKITSAHTMDVGGGWTFVTTDNWTVQSNKAERTGAVTGSDKVHADAGQANVKLTVDATAASGATLIIEIILRYVNTTNYWYAYAFNAAGVFLNELTAGVDTNRASGTLTLVDGQTYAMRADCNGDQIDIYIDGTLKAAYNSSSHNTSTKFGLGAESSTSTYDPKYDNFLVTTI